MTGDVVVVGASAGGVEALRALTAGLPVGLPAPVVVVLHIPRSAPSALAAILTRSGPLPARAAEHGMVLQDGVVHVAPADRHLLVVDGRLHLSSGPAENGHRPAIDPLFRSAAVSHGPRAIGVVLSGTRDDGSAGLAAIAAHGGDALVQDPADALYATMPGSALEQVPGAQALPAAKLGAEIGELLAAPDRARRAAPAAPDALLDAEHRIAAARPDAPGTEQLPAAVPSGLSCPDCDGVLFELPGLPSPRYRCRVGHAWAAQSLTIAQAEGVDTALWTALRALEEKVALLRRLAADAERAGWPLSARRHHERVVAAERDAAVLRDLLYAQAGDAVDVSVVDGPGVPAGAPSGDDLAGEPHGTGS